MHVLLLNNYDCASECNRNTRDFYMFFFYDQNVETSFWLWRNFLKRDVQRPGPLPANCVIQSGGGSRKWPEKASIPCILLCAWLQSICSLSSSSVRRRLLQSCSQPFFLAFFLRLRREGQLRWHHMILTAWIFPPKELPELRLNSSVVQVQRPTSQEQRGGTKRVEREAN